MHKPLVLLALAAALAACSPAPAPTAPAVETPASTPSPAVGKGLETRIVNAAGAQIGFANFHEGPSGVVIRLEFNPRALTPGWHGAHLHENGDCADFAAGFKASGAHVKHGEEGEAHGLLNAAGPEAGDLANIFVADTDGPFGAEVYSTMVTLAPEAHEGRRPLLSAQGAALILHANADDHATQPIGGAGDRVACAVLKP
ncbi:MAG: superoxide dismutase family protein [Alphaproteobacteria bacterium]|nr:superoxide dismutase family protein [Alphaproteobacteria bacterium]